MLKKFAVNTISSLVMLILTGIAFTFLGIFVVDLLGGFSIVGLIALFCALLGFGYYIGRQLYSDKKMGFVSIIVIPIVVLIAVYGIFMVVASVVSMILQYPAAVWLESLNIKADNTGIMFYVVAFAHYFVYALSMLVGAYKKHKV